MMPPHGLPRATENPWKTRSSRVAYESPWLRVREDQVLRPDGQDGVYGVVELPYPVAIVAALDEDRRLYLVRQWRYAWNCDSWELPAGRCELSESPLAGAKRELLEEAGLHARTWTALGEFFASALIGTRFHFFLAQELEQHPPRRDAEERDMIVQRVPLADVVAAAADGTIIHAASVASILRLSHYIERHSPPGALSAVGLKT